MPVKILITVTALALALSSLPAAAKHESPARLTATQAIVTPSASSFNAGVPSLPPYFLNLDDERNLEGVAANTLKSRRDFIPGADNATSLKPSAFTTTVTVTTTNESGPGSLREALLMANASMTPVEIDFAVSGVITEQTSLLPSISKPVFINGASAPGFLGSPRIGLNGYCANNPFGAKNGLFFETNAGGSIVRGIAFYDFDTDGCSPSPGGPGIMGASAGNMLVTQCDFGATGAFFPTASGSNFTGIIPGSSWTIAYCNVTRNSHGGINIQNNINAVRVQNSVIGIDRGNLAVGNGSYGISVSASNAAITNCVISGSGNGLYGANRGPGLLLSGSNAVIAGNLIGTTVDGGAAWPNLNGIVVSNANQVSILNNLISGNQGNGIQLGNGVNNITIQGNFIGTNFQGRYAVPNSANGIRDDGASNNTKIGGTTLGAGNLISGNRGSGISMSHPNQAVIQGNFIGSDLKGNPLGSCNYSFICDPNSYNVNSNLLDGINIDFGNTVTIGVPNPFLTIPSGVTTGIGLGSNLIAYNGRNGIALSNPTGNGVKVNRIYSNGSLGIDNGNDGVTPNRPCGDGPTNFPIITLANTQNGITSIAGTLTSSANTAYTINFYYNSACDPSGNGEGADFIGAIEAQTDNSCVATFNFGIPSMMVRAINTSLPAGGFITATAIDSSGNSSEFSQCRLVTADSTQADLTVSQTFSPGRVVAGATVTYRIQVRNNGPDGASQVTLRDTLPQGTSFVSCNASAGGVCGGSGNDRTVSYSALASGAVSDITITATVDSSAIAGTAMDTLVTFGSSTPDPNPTNNFSQARFVISSGPLPIIQFETGENVNSEGSPTAWIWVTRTVDLSGASTVDFATTDGTASQRTKYIPASGTLNFAPGEFRKFFTVQITDGNYVEGDTTVNLTLSNAVNATLGLQATSILTIRDNDTAMPTTNPLDGADALFFVRQHYNDFLGREPDLAGYDYWSGQIRQCSNDAACLRARKTDVSNAFYYEQEFQQTGSFVFRLYRISYGNNQPFPNNHPDPMFPNEEKKLPNYSVFVADRSRVIGGSNLAQNQLDLASAFVQRPEFQTKYPLSLATADQFVDAVLQTLGNDLNVNLSAQRANLIALYNQGGRGAVIYRLADDSTGNPINNRVLIDAEYNRAFVATQYFGYLRRNPDIAGFLFWLGQVNGAPLRDVAKQHAMVCSFITAAEYQQRFSPVVTHSNADCQ